MASERAKAIWDQSIPIAAFVAGEAESWMTATPLSSDKIGWQLLEIVCRVSGALVQPSHVIQQIKNAVRRGTLIASGFRHAPSKSRSPVLISGAAFASSRIQLFREAIIVADRGYSDVRLIPRARIPALWNSERPKQAVRQAAIVAVIRGLHKRGKLSGLRKQQVAAVREALDHHGIENPGTDKTIERLIRNSLNLPARKAHPTLCAKRTRTRRPVSPDA